MTRKRHLLAATTAATIALGALGTLPATAADAPIAIDIVGINDFHGRLSESSPAAGAAVLAGMVDSYKAANPNTVFVSSGDNVGASTFTSFIQDDQPTIDSLNAAGLAVSALGNHEFDRGQSDLDDRIIPNSDYSYIASNIYKSGTDEHAYNPYAIEDVDGVKIGFIGAVTEKMPELVSPAGIAGLDFRDVVDSVNETADELTDGDPSNGEADVLILLVHEGAASATLADSTDDSDFGHIAKDVSPKVQAILSAHTHQKYDHDIVPTGGTTARPVIQTGSYGENYSHLALSVDPTTHELDSISSEVLPLYRAFTPNTAVAKIVSDAEAVAAVKGSVKLGTITGDFNRARQSDGTTENRGGESTLGNFVADVQLAATTGTGSQIAFMNPGGLRADLKYGTDGTVTYQAAAAVQPFANTLVQVGMTGAQIRQVLEQQWQPAGASRPFLKLGVSKGLVYTYDPAAAAGSHIGTVTLNGEALDPAATYQVTVNSFLASGGDNFTAFAAGATRADTGKIDLQSQVDYFTANPTATPDLAQRAVGVTLSAAPAGGAAPAGSFGQGSTVDAKLSSLVFSSGGPTTGAVTATLGDTVIGESAIDGSVVDTTDEQGRASMALTIPANAPAGPQELTFTVKGTGTVVSVPVTIAAAAKPIKSTSAPTLSGTAKAGKTLKATAGTWNVGKVDVAYQWLRDGEAISGATKSKYTLTGADAGAKVSVAVTASKAGYADATRASKAVTVAKVTAVIRLYTDKKKVAKGESFHLSGTLTAGFDVVPGGTVTLLDNGKKLGTEEIRGNGTYYADISDLKPGKHVLVATYSGDEHVAATASRNTVVVTVK